MKKPTFYKNMMIALVLFLGLTSNDLKAQSGYVAGDFHQHSTFTDGSWSLGYVIPKNADYGLDWWANSEHGGGFTTHGGESGIDKGTLVFWDQLVPNPVIGTVSLSGGHQRMWRWQSLRDYSFPIVMEARLQFPQKMILQGYEMNVPGHEHGSVCVLGEQFSKNEPNVNALVEFEYRFDNSDADVTGGAAQGWIKSTLTGHAKTLEAVDWLQANHAGSSWLIPAHPERQRKYTIAHFRDMNNHGPDVCFGFESMPGHQKGPQRGGYGSGADGGGTYGGCGVYAARVGGLWDAMLSEERHFWLFASSDFHDTDDDFFPGEYQKTYTYVQNRVKAEAIVEGLRSGNSWIVNGDLIDMLEFNAFGHEKVTMGESLKFGKRIIISVLIRDPETPNNNGDYPVLDHVDIIMGKLTGRVDPSSPDYNNPTAPGTTVIARFDRIGGTTDASGLRSLKWEETPNGFISINYVVNTDEPCYFRLRGTNLSINVPGETDAFGNPMLDVVGQNTPELSWNDLWFYSNPIFAHPHPSQMKSGTDESDKPGDPRSDLSTVTAYPNPASGTLNFAGLEGLSKITVFNTAGQVVLSTEMINDVLDISKLKKGLYFVRISNNGNFVNIPIMVE